jgi:hypothetical protein
MWNKPIDVVTRISAHPEPRRISNHFPYDDFRIYEEFPLYHMIAAKSGRFGLSLEKSGRLLSVISFILGGFGIFALSRFLTTPILASISTLLWSISFPVLYYGQSIMSDMSMTAFAIWSFYFLARFLKQTTKKLP